MAGRFDDFIAGHGNGGAAVKSKPAHPQDKHAKACQGDAVAGDGIYAAILIVLADSGSQKPCPYEGAHAANQMDAGGTGEIMESHFRKPAAAPDPMAGNGVNQKGDDHGINAVGGELRPFRHGAGHDGGGGGAEHGLEEEVRHGGIACIIGHLEMGDEKIRRTDNAADVRAEHEAEAKEPEHHGAQGKVHEILHDDVACVLRTGQSSLHHGKPRLHKVHQDSA